MQLAVGLLGVAAGPARDARGPRRHRPGCTSCRGCWSPGWPAGCSTPPSAGRRWPASRPGAAASAAAPTTPPATSARRSASRSSRSSPPASTARRPGHAAGTSAVAGHRRGLDRARRRRRCWLSRERGAPPPIGSPHAGDSRSAAPSAGAAPTPSTTSRSCRRGAPATPRRSRVAWQIDAYRFELPIVAAPMDSVMSPRDRDRASASTAASACSTSRASGPGTTTRPTCSPRSPSSTARRAVRRMQEIYAEPVKAELITARLKQMRDAGVTVAGSLSPAAHQGVRQDRGRRRRRHVRDPRHHGQRRARLRPGRAAEPQGVHLRARRAGDRRRLRDVPGGAAPDAHRRRGRAGRLRRRRGAHHPHRARRLGADGQRGRRRRRAPAATTWTSPAAATCT